MFTFFDTATSSTPAPDFTPIYAPPVSAPVTIMPGLPYTQSGLTPGTVAPTSTAGSTSNSSTAATIGSIFTNIGAAIQGATGSSAQGGAVASGGITAGAGPTTAQSLLSSPIVWISLLVIGAVVVGSSLHKGRK